MAYQRKTRDEFQVHGYYQGWEEVTCADNRKEARGYLKDYRDNEPGTAFKLITKRVPIALTRE